MIRSAHLLGVVVLTVLHSYAHGQRAGILLEPEGVVSPSSPDVWIRIAVWFDYTPRQAELFASARFSVEAAEGRFTDYATPWGPGVNVGGPVLTPCLGSQIHFPPTRPGNPANPFPFGIAKWTTANFTPRRVPLSAIAERIVVYPEWASPQSWPLPPENLVPGSAFIRVVPTASAVPVPAALMAFRRRR